MVEILEGVGKIRGKNKFKIFFYFRRISFSATPLKLPQQNCSSSHTNILINWQCSCMKLTHVLIKQREVPTKDN